MDHHRETGDAPEETDDAAPARAITLEHDGRIESVSISPDGRFALSGGGEERVVCLWDLENGTEIGRLRNGGNWVTSVAFLGSGRQIAVLGDCSFSIWDCAAEERLSEDFGKMRQMCVSSDGRFVLLGHERGEAELRNTERRIAVGSLGDPHEAHVGKDVQAVAFSTGISHALTASQEEVKLWKIDARKAEGAFRDRQWKYEIGELLHRYEDTWLFGVARMAFLPGGREAIVLSGKIPLLIDVQNGGVTGRFEAGVPQWNDFAISADGRRIAVTHNTDQGNFVSVLDSALRRKILTFEEHVGVVTSVAISADGRRVVSGSDDEAVRVWTI